MADVVQMPTPLARLAELIKADLSRREHGRAEWIEATLDLCQHLAEARARFPADIAFGRWCEESGFALEKNDRAAAIAMGEHIEEARPVLEKTERKSLRLIYAEECRFPNTGKPKRGKTDNPKGFRKGGVTAIFEALGGKYDIPWTAMNQRKAEAEMLLGYPIPKTFTDPDALRRVVEDYESIVVPILFAKKQAAVEPEAEDEPLAPSKQERFDAALRVAKRKLELEFEEKIEAEIKRRLEEMVIPSYQKKMADADRVVKARKGIMTKGQYRKLLACLHPDATKSEWAAELFQIVKDNEIVFLAEKEMPTSSGTLPQTLAELLARRKKKW